jgi:predicted dehydrogenase
MNLTEEQKTEGRRNFLKALAGTPALVALGAAATTVGPVSGGPVKAGVVGVGGMGTELVARCQKEFIDVRAVCDINPRNRQKVAAAMVKAGWPEPRQYEEWREMLEKEEIEAVINATPLWAHADIVVGCLDAGKHVLSEKMMAKTEPDCRRMLEAARRNNRVLEIGYQRYYNPMYQATYDNIIKAGVLGDVYHARLVWHRGNNWRRKQDPPAPDYNPSKWGYPDWDHLLNWRVYRQYSEGLVAELGSHMLTVANWFFDSAPEAVYTTGGINRFKDREVFDHVYATFDYPGGRNVTFSSIESNGFEEAYEMFLGTKGTLVLKRETEAYLFPEKGAEGGPAPAAQVTKVETSPQSANPIADASATRPTNDPQGRTADAGAATQQQTDRGLSYRDEIAGFCAAVRTGQPVRCGPEKAMRSAVSVFAANQAADQKARVAIPKV